MSEGESLRIIVFIKLSLKMSFNIKMINQSKTLAPEPREQQTNNTVIVIFLFSIWSGKPDIVRKLIIIN